MPTFLDKQAPPSNVIHIITNGFTLRPNRLKQVDEKALVGLWRDYLTSR